MSYNTDSSGSTLTDTERMDEARRILRRIQTCSNWERRLTDAAVSFINEKLAQLDMFDSVGSISIKQLYYLRDSADRID